MWILIVPTVVLFVGVIACLYAWALTLLWGWFLVPLGAPAITLPVAYGISLINGLYRGNGTAAAKDKDPFEVFAEIIMKPFAVIALGWLVKTLFLG